MLVQCGTGVERGRVVDCFDVGVLTETVPPGLVDEVVEVAGCRERRVRLLPARVVVYCVLGLCLFSGGDGVVAPGYRAVMRILVDRWRDVFAGCVVASGSALTRARARVGVKPFAMLFERVCGPLAVVESAWSHAFGLRLVAWDATTVQVADSCGNAGEFGYHGRSSDCLVGQGPRRARGGAAVGANPLVRVAMVIECGTHAVIDAVFDGVAKASEHVLVRRLIGSLRAGMLLLADRNFPGFELWGLCAATGADLLWRVQKTFVLTPIETLPDGSYLSIVPTPRESMRLSNLRRRNRCDIPRKGHRVRVIEYTITTETGNGHTRSEPFRLITTLLDPSHAPAAELAACYQQRWESENSYNCLKPRLIGRDRTLRSQTPEGVTQELYAFLIVYQALCRLRTEAANTAQLDPDRISFTITIRAVRAHLTLRLTPEQNLQQARHAVIETILQDKLSHRRKRTSPRQRTPHPGKYPNKRRDQPQPSTKTTHKLQLTKHPPANTNP